MNKKKIIIGLIIFICLISVVVIMSGNYNKNGELIEVSYDDIMEKVDNKDSFILVISQSTCSHCATYKPKLKNISRNYGIDIYYINYDFEDKSVQNKFLDKFKLSGATPTTIFIKDGKEASLLNRLEGDLSESRVVEKFKKMGFIEE